jgi:hypothetical protein
MRFPILSVAVAVLITVGPNVRGECGCPPGARSSNRLIATADGSAGGLVVCGYEDARVGERVRGSEFEVFRCGDGRRILEFGALDTADLEAVGADLRVIRVADWPFGVAWQWRYVPVAELLLKAEDDTDTGSWRPRLPKAEVAPEAVLDFLIIYREALRDFGQGYAPDEDIVARLFAAMASGNAEAGRLFGSMPEDVNLDGAAAEVYAMAVEDFRVGAQPPHSAPRRANREDRSCDPRPR